MFIWLFHELIWTGGIELYSSFPGELVFLLLGCMLGVWGYSTVLSFLPSSKGIYELKQSHLLWPDDILIVEVGFIC